jgi:type IV secretion system protein VirB9
VDSRIRATPYDGEQVYRLHGFVGYQIDLEFEAGEAFVGLGAGDIEGLSYFGQDNHLFLKPKAAKVATNLTVLTNRRHYQFDYTAMAQSPRAGDPNVIFALRFTYPAVPSKAAQDAAATQIDAELGLASARRRQNFDYWYCGSPTLRPVLASDDGVHTRLRFAANGDLPAIFVRSEDNGESLLNYSMDNGDVIIHRIARRFILRRGKLTACIVNRGFVGGGMRLDSGTVTPDVERRLQGGAP